MTQIGEGRTLGEGPFAWATSRKVPKRPRTGANSGVNHPEIENEEEECYQPKDPERTAGPPDIDR